MVETKEQGVNVFTVALADSGYPLLFFLVFFLGFKFAVFYALDHLFGRFSFFLSVY